MIQIIFAIIGVYFIFISHPVSISGGREVVLPKTKYFGGTLIIIALAMSMISLSQEQEWIIPLLSPVIAIVSLIAFSTAKTAIPDSPAQTMVNKTSNVITWTIMLALLAGLLYVLFMVLSGK